MNNVAPWNECDKSRQTELIQMWKRKWQWQSSVEDILEHCDNTSPPWEAVRLIGHRGSGKTSRPVLH
jgi:energy-coupling factor transporter ATP-binding protein EcfA2